MPGVGYARFERAADMRSDVLRRPPSSAVCVAGLEVAIDALDEGEFAKLCRRMHGDLVDGVSGLPDIHGDDTIAGAERAVARMERRDSAAERRALQRYWANA